MNQIRKEILSLTQEDIARKFDELKRCLIEDRQSDIQEETNDILKKQLAKKIDSIPIGMVYWLIGIVAAAVAGGKGLDKLLTFG